MYEDEVGAQEVIDQAYLIVMQNNIARGAYAEDADGNPTYTDDPNAVAFDAAGAIYRAASELGLTSIISNHVYIEAFSRFIEHVQMNYEISGISEWSDRSTSLEIREMFRRMCNPLVEVLSA